MGWVGQIVSHFNRQPQLVNTKPQVSAMTSPRPSMVPGALGVKGRGVERLISPMTSLSLKLDGPGPNKQVVIVIVGVDHVLYSCLLIHLG